MVREKVTYMDRRLTLPERESGKHMSDREALETSRMYIADHGGSFWPEFERQTRLITTKAKKEFDAKLEKLCKDIEEKLGGKI